MGIRDRPTSPRSPWQNGYAERLIGSIRRECVDHVVVFGERHLRHVLQSYLKYYNETRTHLSLDKDAPIPRAAEAVGRILSRPVLGGLHHQYVRINLRQAQARPFTEKQIDLVTTFADQAVIAIEDVRLFDEVQARTRELSELE
jgi:transposase InsO family protein